MYIHTHMMDHSLIIMSLLQTRKRSGLEKFFAIEEKLSCGVMRTSGELGRCVAVGTLVILHKHIFCSDITRTVYISIHYIH